MRKVLVSVLFQMILCSSAAGQDCKYEKYFYWSEMATLDYQSKKWAGANDKFKKSFSKTAFPLAADLNLALKIAVEVRDTLWADTIAVQLAKGGIPLAFFQPFKNYAWYESFEKSYDRYQAYYHASFDTTFRAEFIALCIQDSLFNDKYHQWRTGKIEMTLDELIAGAGGISQTFKNLVKARGFPCEQKMGYYFKDANVAEFPVLVLLAHIYQRGELLYKDRLTNIVCDGKFRRMQQAMLNGFNGFGDNTGIEQEMKIRYEKYRIKN